MAPHTSTATSPAAASTASDEDVFIIWDSQNVRLPREMPAQVIMKHLHDVFVTGRSKLPCRPRMPRRCRGCVSTFTEGSRRAMMANGVFNSLVNNGSLNVTMIYAAGKCRKTSDADHPLIEAMLSFAVDCLVNGRHGVVVLITGDADFVRPALWCKQIGGVSMNLLFYKDNVSKDVRGLDVDWSMEWTEFLDDAWSHSYPQDGKARKAWTFNYSDSEALPGPASMEKQHPPHPRGPPIPITRVHVPADVPHPLPRPSPRPSLFGAETVENRGRADRAPYWLNSQATISCSTTQPTTQPLTQTSQLETSGSASDSRSDSDDCSNPDASLIDVDGVIDSPYADLLGVDFSNLQPPAPESSPTACVQTQTDNKAQRMPGYIASSLTLAWAGACFALGSWAACRLLPPRFAS